MVARVGEAGWGGEPGRFVVWGGLLNGSYDACGATVAGSAYLAAAARTSRRKQPRLGCATRRVAPEALARLLLRPGTFVSRVGVVEATGVNALDANRSRLSRGSAQARHQLGTNAGVFFKRCARRGGHDGRVQPPRNRRVQPPRNRRVQPPRNRRVTAA